MSHEPDITEAVAAAERRARLEHDIACDLLRFPSRGMDLARAVGVTADDFDQPDLQTIFVAVDWWDANRHADLLLAVRRALQWAGYWRENVPRGSRGMYHGPASLAWMARGELPCPAFLPARLLELKALSEAFARKGAA